MQWATIVNERPMDSKRQWILLGKKFSSGSSDRRGGLEAKTWSEIGVRRFSGRHHNPCGGLHDSAAEAWIIRAITLGVLAIIKLVHIFNIHWDILGRHILEEAKGQLSWDTGHVPIKTYKHVRVCCQRADFYMMCVYLYTHADKAHFWPAQAYLLTLLFNNFKSL